MRSGATRSGPPGSGPAAITRTDNSFCQAALVVGVVVSKTSTMPSVPVPADVRERAAAAAAALSAAAYG